MVAGKLAVCCRLKLTKRCAYVCAQGFFKGLYPGMGVTLMGTLPVSGLYALDLFVSVFLNPEQLLVGQQFDGCFIDSYVLFQVLFEL